MKRDSIKLSLAAATILTTGILTTTPASAISFKFTLQPPYTLNAASGPTFVSNNSAGSPTVSGTFIGDIDNKASSPFGSGVRGSVTLGNTRLGDVGTGYFFGGSYIQQSPGGFRFHVTGDLGQLWGGRESIYMLDFVCYLNSQNSCNGSQGTYMTRTFSTTTFYTGITISDFSWETPITPTPTPTQPPISNPAPTPTQSPIDTPSQSASTSVPEPSTTSALILVAGGWLWCRKFATKSPKDKLAVQ